MAINLNPYNYNSLLFNNSQNAGVNYANNIYSMFANSSSPVVRTTNTQLDWRTSAIEAAKKESSTSTSALTSEGKEFVTEAKKSASSLSSVLSDLMNKTSSSLDNKAATSSNSDVLTIKSVDSKKATSMNGISVNVSQIATTQENTGISADAKSNAISSGMTAGANKFKLEVGGKHYYMDVVVSSKDTNQDVQKKIAESINSQNIGVKASVTYDNETNQSTLKIESLSTGVDKEGDLKFSLSDVSGNAVKQYGANNVSQMAQNAVYTVNDGYKRTSKTNDVDIGNGITATLKSASAASVNVSMSRDTSSAIDDVRTMVNSFNSLMSAAEDNIDDKKSAALYQSLFQLAYSNTSSLGKIGITLNENGYLKIDEDKMKQSAENGSLEKFFKADSGMSYGFANRLSRIAQDVNKNADNYVTKALAYSQSYLFDYSL